MSLSYPYELAIVMPCLNEADSVGICIQKASTFLRTQHIVGEIIVADNGSSDGSVAIAEAQGARVVHVREKGYGSALRAGIEAASAKYIIMGDADDSYDFSALTAFVEKCRAGYDLVMGNRFSGGINRGAMPFLHRYLGNPVLSFIGRIFFTSAARDFHCGLRAFSAQAYTRMQLSCRGMEFASEMVIKAALQKMRITEVPTILHQDGRGGREAHLNTWRDGWRHLKLLLQFAPHWLYLLPTLVLLGLSLFTFFYTTAPYQILSSLLLLCAIQGYFFYVYTRFLQWHRNFLASPVAGFLRLFDTYRNTFILGSLTMFALSMLMFCFTYQNSFFYFNAVCALIFMQCFFNFFFMEIIGGGGKLYRFLYALNHIPYRRYILS